MAEGTGTAWKHRRIWAVSYIIPTVLCRL